MIALSSSSYDSPVAKAKAKLYHCAAMPDRWIGTDEEGALVHWPRQEDGYSHRTPFSPAKGKTLVDVDPALARGTGWFGAGSGRRRLGGGDIDAGASSPVTIRATARERARWEAAAEAAGKKLSEWVRERLNKAAESLARRKGPG